MSCVYELTGVETFYGDEVFCSVSVSVRVSEDYFGEGSATTRVMYDFLYDSLDIPNKDQHLFNTYPSLSLKSKVLN